MVKTVVDVVVKVSGVTGFIRGKVFPMDPDAYSSVGDILEEAKKRGQLSITTADGIVAVNTDHIILINEAGHEELG